MVHHGQVLVDPSSITIMIHTTLCAFDELTLIILCNVDVDEYLHVLNIFYGDNRHEAYMINLFSSFSVDEILFVFMTFKMCNQIDHNVCLDE
jgi:hypothetical protein